jgi:FKBP12-rapamycin complex-associated protein
MPTHEVLVLFMMIQVIPQLIARIDTPRALVGRLIHHLLIDIGKHHPQALVYPLTVASKSASIARRNAANKILKNMCEHSPVLVQQAVMVTYHFVMGLFVSSIYARSA